MKRTVEPNCSDCGLRSERLFCDMPVEALQEFDSIATINSYSRGTMLFLEGQRAKGVYVLCAGRANLSFSAQTGTRVLLRVAGPGEVLGLGATMVAGRHTVTAELLDDCQIVHVGRKAFMQFLREHNDICLAVLNILSRDLHCAYDRVRKVGLSKARKPRVRPDESRANHLHT